MFTTDLAPDEALVEVELPPVQPRTGWSFLEVARRSGDYAMMGVAVCVTLDENGSCQSARLVYLNAGEGPVVARQAAESLIGSDGSASALEFAAVTASEDEIDPLGNLHASPEYQRHLAHILTVRALTTAFERARRH
jgi:carbon-monoxide dehydrogenase medium subunit